MCGDGSDAGKEIELQNLQRQQAVQRGMTNINSVFGKFDEPYYEGIRNTTLNTLMPQFQTQQKNVSRGAAYGLASRGLLNSGAAKETGTELQKESTLGRILVNNQANQAVSNARQDIGRQQAQVTSQLVQSQDPALAAQQALTSAASVGAPSLIAPLGDLFQNFSNAYLARQLGQTSNRLPSEPVRGTLPTGQNYFVK